MSSREKEGLPQKEHLTTLYLKAARFTDGSLSQQVYFQTHTTIERAKRAGEISNLASYHLTDQEQLHWYVALVGTPPPPALEEHLLSVLALGEQTRLPERFAALVTRYLRRGEVVHETREEWL